MRKRHVVRLTDDQRAASEDRGRGPLTRRERNRVQVPVRADAGETDAEVADGPGVSVGTVANVRKRFVAGGLDAALTEKPRPGAAPLSDGGAEAVAIAPACSPTPDGAARWSARLLANKSVEPEVVGSVSEDAILRALKKAASSRGGRRVGACPKGWTGRSPTRWGTCSNCTPSRTTRGGRWWASTRPGRNSGGT